MKTLFTVLSLILYLVTVGFVGKWTRSIGWSLGCMFILSPLIYFGSAIGYNGFLNYIHRSTCAEYQKQVVLADPFPEIRSFRWVFGRSPSRAIVSDSIDFVEILANGNSYFSGASDFDAEGDAVWMRVRTFPIDQPEAGLQCLEIRTDMSIGLDFRSRLVETLEFWSIIEDRCAAMDVVSEDQLQAPYQFTWRRDITPELTGFSARYLSLRSYEIKDVRTSTTILHVFRTSLLGENIWRYLPFGYTAARGAMHSSARVIFFTNQLSQLSSTYFQYTN